MSFCANTEGRCCQCPGCAGDGGAAQAKPRPRSGQAGPGRSEAVPSAPGPRHTSFGHVQDKLQAFLMCGSYH